MLHELWRIQTILMLKEKQDHMECQKQKNKKIYPYLLLYGYSFFVLHINKYIQISCSLFTCYTYIYITLYVIHFLYCISINIFKFLADYLHAIHIFILHILYIFIAYNAICITSAFLYYMQVLLHMLLVYF